jgi:hypothetical protein
MKKFLQALALSIFAIAITLPVAAQAPAKKLIRIHTAGPADLGVDNTMLAHQFMTRTLWRRKYFLPASSASRSTWIPRHFLGK